MMGLLTQTRQLLLYTLWADRMLLNAIREVKPEDLTRDAGVSFGSLLGTWSTSWARSGAGSRGSRAARPSPARGWRSSRTCWPRSGLGGDRRPGSSSFLASLTEDQLAAEITWEDTEIGPVTRPLWQPVTHMVNHSTYHRGQVVSLMRQLGYPPPKTDLIHFFLR